MNNNLHFLEDLFNTIEKKSKSKDPNSYTKKLSNVIVLHQEFQPVLKKVKVKQLQKLVMMQKPKY